MKRIVRILPFFLFIFLLDRFFFLPGRMDGAWHYESGVFLGDPITFVSNIDIINNFEIKIQKTGKFDPVYLLGCYFGNLYLLDKDTFECTRYTRIEGSGLQD